MTHTFHPYRTDGDRRIVATEAEWLEIEDLNRQAQTAKCGRCGSEYDIADVPEEEWPFECDMREEDGSPCGRVNEKPKPIGVIVDAEMFDWWDGWLFNADGKQAFWDTDEWMPHCVAGGPYLEMDDVRNRLFKLIDRCPHLRWMLPTNYPAEAFKSYPVTWYRGELSPVLTPPSNLYLSVRVANQSDADRIIPELLRIPGNRGVFLDGQTEGIDFSAIKLGRDKTGQETCDVLKGVYTVEYHETHEYPGGIQVLDGGPRIEGVTQRGGADALHPAWVRQTRDQCEGAGVPYAFIGWGEWIPWTVDARNNFDFDPDTFSFMCHLIANPNGDVRQFPTSGQKACIQLGYTTFKKDDVHFVNVGPARSGKVLDGREWEGVPE